MHSGHERHTAQNTEHMHGTLPKKYCSERQLLLGRLCSLGVSQDKHGVYSKSVPFQIAGSTFTDTLSTPIFSVVIGF